MGFITNLLETLDKSFYSERESKIEFNNIPNLTQDTPEMFTQEAGVMPGDVSSNTLTMGGQVDFVLQEKSRLINLWREISYTPEVADAIEEIINEALVFDELGNAPFELDLDDIEINDSLKESIREAYTKINKLLDFSDKGDTLFKQWYTDGSMAFEVVYNNKKLKNGIHSLKILNPQNFYKVKDPKTRQIRYFMDTNIIDPNKSQQFSLMSMYENSTIKYLPEQITYTESGLYSKDRLFPISFLSLAQKVVNDLQMIEESLLIYRFTRAPQRNAITVNVGRMPKSKAEQYIKSMMAKHRTKVTYNTETGEVENRGRSIAMQEDIWLSENADGQGTKIEALNTATMDVAEIADLDYFYRKLWRALKVPVNRRDPESRSNPIGMNNLETENEEIKFFKFVLKMRKRFVGMFVDLLKKELIATKTFSLEDWENIEDQIKFKFKNNNDFAESKKLAALEGQGNIADQFLRMYEEKLVSKQWIKENILMFTDEEIDEIKKQVDKEQKEDPPPEDGY